jgi:hypothetical protein
VRAHDWLHALKISPEAIFLRATARRLLIVLQSGSL